MLANSSRTFQKTLFYSVALLTIALFLLFSLRRIGRTRSVISHQHIDTDFSQLPPLPDWTSIRVMTSRPIPTITSKDASRTRTEPSLQPLSIEQAYSRRWIVITSINYPTASIAKLSKLKGWALVLVGDLSTPKNWSHPNCVFLSVDDQKKLHFDTHSIVPYRHYGRKNIGYLYAIQHGAEIIYETDDDNELIAGIERQVLELHDGPESQKAYFLPASSQQVRSFVSTPISSIDATIKEEQMTVNPYHYFGQPLVWPRGYPLRLIGDEIPLRTDQFIVRPLIQQGLANSDPDLDAIFRLTQSNRRKRIKITFEERPPVAISHGLLVPFNSQNTVFHYDAFWALWIPITTTFRVCDIWRGYFAQRLLWELSPQTVLTFHSPSVLQHRNPHNYLLDFVDEWQLYTDTERLIIFLRAWTCSQGGTHLAGRRDCTVFFNKIFFLAVDMVEAGFWKMKDAWLCRSFLVDLVRSGYRYNLTHRANQNVTWALASNKTQAASGNHSASIRVAVCVSGQPRTLSMVLPSVIPVMTMNPSVYAEGSTWRKSAFANQTTADSIQNMLFSKLPAFDVFMYVSTKEQHHREPKVNDTTVCEPLRPRSQSNRLFCSVKREADINNPSTNLSVFNTYIYGASPPLRQGLLQQLDGLLQCNAMRKKHSEQTGTQYTHWIRLRPDSPFLEYFPNIETMPFVDGALRQPIVTYANKAKCCCGNEDWFGVGSIETMDAYFDRIRILDKFSSAAAWSAETFAAHALKVTANAQLIGNNPMVQACIFKPSDRRWPGDP